MANKRVQLRSKKNIGRHAAVRTPWKHHGVFPSIQAVFAPGKKQALHDAGYRIVQPRFIGLEAKFRKELDAVYNNPASYNPRKMKQVFRETYTQAFRLGLWAANGGMGTQPPQVKTEDKGWLEKFIEKEYTLWKRFLADVQNKRGRMDYDKRREMYVQALHSVFNGARVIASPPMTLYYWETKPAEHCPHCLYLAQKSPFIKDNLPTLPASGDTQCRSNCKCQLRIEQAPVWKYLKIKQKAPTREELLKGMQGASR